MPDSTEPPAPMAFSHPPTEETRGQQRIDEDPAARDVEFTAPTSAKPQVRQR